MQPEMTVTEYKDGERVTSVVQGSSALGAAMFTGLGGVDSISQLSKSLMTSVSIVDLVKTWSAPSAAMFTGLGGVDSISQLSKSLMTSVSIVDLVKTWSAPSAAMFTGLGGVDSISQLSKSLMTSVSIVDLVKTSSAPMMALSRPAVDEWVATGLGYAPEEWTSTGTGALIRPEQDPRGMGFLDRSITSPSCVYDESSQRRDRLACRLVLTTVATSYLVYYALSPNEILRLIALLLSIGGVSSERIWTLTGKVASILVRASDG
jgi:hypothetical protein